jgi:transposase
MKPFSNDMRSRIIEAYNSGRGSMREVAEQFGVCSQTVNNWIQRFRTSGSFEPMLVTPGPAAKIREEHYPIIYRMVKTNSDATLKQYCSIFYQETKIQVSTTKMCQVLKKLKLKLKKRSPRLRTGPRKSTDTTK